MARVMDTQKAVANARERSGREEFVGTIYAYCDRPDCPARRVEVRFKEHGAPVPVHLTCPACRQVLVIDQARTDKEVREYEEVQARMSVNVQLYKAQKRRTHPELSMVRVPLSVFLDHRLPSVSPGWFDQLLISP